MKETLLATTAEQTFEREARQYAGYSADGFHRLAGPSADAALTRTVHSREYNLSSCAYGCRFP